ncbi:MAG: tetratricopeptide repeat protein, partial [Betaproteobacteria bacterium]|nr:tetratricopeptide repeat protein [Betaproteobacteria bacterium]
QFEEALSRDAAFPMALDYLARLDVYEKKPEHAKQRFVAVLEKYPNNEIAALSYSAFLKSQRGTFEDVVAPLKAVARGNPAAVRARIALVQFHLANNDPKTALAIAQEAESAAPRNPAVIELLGQTQRDAGELNQAITTYMRLASLLPESPTPLLLLAELHNASGQHLKAVEALKRAVSLQPNLVAAKRALV